MEQYMTHLEMCNYSKDEICCAEPEDLNNTLEIEDDTECSETPEFNFEFKVIHTEQLVPDGIQIRYSSKA